MFSRLSSSLLSPTAWREVPHRSPSVPGHHLKPASALASYWCPWVRTISLEYKNGASFSMPPCHLTPTPSYSPSSANFSSKCLNHWGKSLTSVPSSQLPLPGPLVRNKEFGLAQRKGQKVSVYLAGAPLSRVRALVTAGQLNQACTSSGQNRKTSTLQGWGGIKSDNAY